MKKLFLLVLLLLLTVGNNPILKAQNPEWMNFTNGDNINSLVNEGDCLWVCTGGGLVKLNKLTAETTFFNKANSGLPYNYVNCIAIDGNGNKWIVTGSGLVKYDDTNWTIYDTNSGLPDIYMTSNCIAIDRNENKWIGTTWGGLAKYDDTNWTVYDASNSGLPGNNVNCIAIDGNGNKWIGTNEGLVKYDDTNWTVYDTSNSGLPSNHVHCLAIDESGNKWIGTEWSGLAKFDDTNWTVYNTANSGLPDNRVNCITIDGNGNKWIGVGNPVLIAPVIAPTGGLAAFNENGIITSVESKDNKVDYPVKFILSQNYPNPFNPVTSIQYAISSRQFVTLKVYDVLGREVATIVNEEKPAGNYEVKFDGANLASGVYFYRLTAGNFVETKKMILLR